MTFTVVNSLCCCAISTQKWRRWVWTLAAYTCGLGNSRFKSTVRQPLLGAVLYSLNGPAELLQRFRCDDIAINIVIIIIIIIITDVPLPTYPRVWHQVRRPKARQQWRTSSKCRSGQVNFFEHVYSPRQSTG